MHADLKHVKEVCLLVTKIECWIMYMCMSMSMSTSMSMSMYVLLTILTQPFVVISIKMFRSQCTQLLSQIELLSKPKPKAAPTAHHQVTVTNAISTDTDQSKPSS